VDAPSVASHRALASGLLGLAWLFLGSAIAFFPLIMNPVVSGLFDADSEADRLAHVDDRLTALRLLLTGGGLSAAFVVFGYLMVRGAMPTWLGVVWIGCGGLFWVGILPLWFFVGAFAFGIRGVVRFRAGSSTSARISATPHTEPNHDTSVLEEAQS